MRIVLLLIVALTLVLGAGCVSTTVMPAANGQAYVENGSWFGTKMLICDASDGNPECWPVNEHHRR